jgi:glycosyltransferase involved in cell wall biosynthesis
VPIIVNYLPVFGARDTTGESVILPWPRHDAFTIGFVGNLTEQKGWKVLLTAMERLPRRFKVVIVGDGEQREEVRGWLQKPRSTNRAYWTGILSKDRLLATYPLFDVFVLPSITTPHSVEQFGAVLAEAMACGVPVIGSDSGAIPETIGEAGLVVPEGDPDALAWAITRMSQDEELRRRCIARGLERFHAHFSCEAYAHSIGGLFGL